MKRVLFVAMLIAPLTACQAPLRPVFPIVSPPIVWPPAPDAPRIRYVGELTGEASLGARRSGWAAVGEALTGPSPTLAFSTPTAIAVRGDRVYVTDPQSRCAFLLDLAGRTMQTIQGPADRRMEWPIDVTLTDDRLAVADAQRGEILLFDMVGRFVGGFGKGHFQRPVAIAWNPVAAEFWILDAASHACIVCDRDGANRRTIGSRGEAPGEFNFPSGLGFREPFGSIVADSMNFRIQVLDDQAQVLRMLGRKGDAAGDFSLPRDAAFDSEGHLYVLDSQFENVQIFDPTGKLLMAFGREGRGPGQFYLPSGITIDDQDRIWIADTYNRRIQVFQYLPQPQENLR